MAATHFGVVYSAGNAHQRRIVVTESDEEAIPLLPGEALVMVKHGPYADREAFQAAITNAITTAAGKAPGNPRCAVIDSNGNVVNVIMADAAIDSIPGMTLVNHPSVEKGDTFSGGTFTRSAHVNGKGVTVPASDL